MAYISKYGPVNEGSDCYLNCAIVSLFWNKKSPFLEHISKQTNDEKCMLMVKLIRRATMIDRFTFTEIKKYFPQYMVHGQQDVIECIDILFDIFGLPQMEVVSVRESSTLPFKENPEYSSNTHNKFKYISIPNSGETTSISSEFSKQFEDLGDNKQNWIHDSEGNPKFRFSRENIRAIKSNYMLFSINRTKSQSEKYSNEVKFPIFIGTKNNQTYKLICVILHHGSSPSSGHYTALIYHNGKKYRYDDSSSQGLITETNIDNAYIYKTCTVLVYIVTNDERN